MNTQHPPRDRTGNAASSTRVRILAAVLVLTAVAGIASTVAAPDDSGTPDPDPEVEARKRAEDSYVDRFRRAQRLMGRGADEEAEKLFRQLIDERPEEASVHHAFGLLLQFRKRPDDATKELLAAAKLAPDEAVIQRDTAAHLLSLGRAADAEPLFAAASRLWPQDVETAIGHGAALRALGRTAEAQAAYVRAVASDANSVDAAVGLAACRVDAHPDEALKLIESATGQWPDVLLVRGMAYLRLERYDEAIESLEKIVAVAPPGPAGLTFVRGAAEALVLCGAAKPAGIAAAKWVEAQSAAGSVSDAARLCLGECREAAGDHKGALDALAAPSSEKSPAGLCGQMLLVKAAALVHADRGAESQSTLETLAASAHDGFERSSALRLLGRFPAAEFARLAAQSGRANDVAWIESFAAELAGDAPAAAAARLRAAEASKPPGEFPGLLARPLAAPK